ncbi:MAG: UbiA family prenyltransferase [Dehalococcoidia bacterium]
MSIRAVRVVHPFPSVLVALVTLALVPLADADAPLRLYAVLGGGMLLFQAAIGTTNDIVDVQEDRTRKPWKPLARGDLSRRTAVVLAASLAVGGLLLTLALPPAAWAIGASGLAAGLAYDLWLKRTVLSWLPYSVALPLVPLWVYASTETWTPVLWWALPLGALLGLSLHLANEAPDVATDGTTEDVPGLPGRLGERRSRTLSLVLFALVAAAVAVLAARTSMPLGVGSVVTAAVVLAAAAAPARFGRDGLFGVLAVGAAVLAVAFLLSA